MSAPINLVMQKEWKAKFRPEMAKAVEEQGNGDEYDGEREDSEEEESATDQSNRINYSL